MAIDKNKIAAPIAITDPWPTSLPSNVPCCRVAVRDVSTNGVVINPCAIRRLHRYPTTILSNPAGSRHTSINGKEAKRIRIKAYAMA